MTAPGDHGDSPVGEIRKVPWPPVTHAVDDLRALARVRHGIRVASAARRRQGQSGTGDIRLAALEGGEEFVQREGLAYLEVDAEFLRQRASEFVVEALGAAAAQVIGGRSVTRDEAQLAAIAHGGEGIEDGLTGADRQGRRHRAQEDEWTHGPIVIRRSHRRSLA